LIFFGYSRDAGAKENLLLSAADRERCAKINLGAGSGPKINLGAGLHPGLHPAATTVLLHERSENLPRVTLGCPKRIEKNGIFSGARAVLNSALYGRKGLPAGLRQ
jgi:hypothetical protein